MITNLKTTYDLNNFSDFEVLTRGNTYMTESISIAIQKELKNKGLFSTLNNKKLLNMISIDVFDEPLFSADGLFLADSKKISVIYTVDSAKISSIIDGLKPSIFGEFRYSGGMILSVFEREILLEHEDISSISLTDNLVYNAIMIQIILLLTRS